MPFTDDDPRHGTPAGYQQHRVKGVPQCRPCLAAHRDMMRERRKKKGVRESENRASAVRLRALHRLRALYAADYDRLVADEWRAERGEIA